MLKKTCLGKFFQFNKLFCPQQQVTQESWSKSGSAKSGNPAIFFSMTRLWALMMKNFIKMKRNLS
jgi:hypothetical protein